VEKINELNTPTEKKEESRASRWIANFFVMGGWILVLIVTIAICAAIRTIFNY
jgi:hypothetical protein